VTSGECMTVPQAQLEPFPLRVDDGTIWIRPSHD
jgi:nitrite reductase/ring-hydroxylating ferredoxin subunit